MNLAAFFRGTGAAKKQPGLSTELKENTMASVLELTNPTKSKKQPPAGTVHWFDQCVSRGKRERFSEEVVVTPGLANVILGNNPDNRNIRPMKLTQFATDMRSGAWAFNGEPIIIARSGELNDGQHRLNALIAANTSIPLLFVFGVERDTRLTVDQGGARGAHDYLGMESVPHATIVASVCRLVVGFERSRFDNINDANRVTNAEVMQRARSDERTAKSAAFAAEYYSFTRNFAAPAVIGFCHYILTGEHPGDADEYMRQICTGEGLKKNDPAYVVRDRLLSLGRNRGHKIEIILRGWNAYRSNRPLKLVKVLGNFPALV